MYKVWYGGVGEERREGEERKRVSGRKKKKEKEG